MQTVFIVQHSYEDGDHEEVKFIGVYASIADAEAAVARLRDQPGFRDHRLGFNIDAYVVGQDHWQTGFVSYITIMVPLLDQHVAMWRPVEAEMLSDGLYRIVGGNSDPGERWAFNTGQIVRCEERDIRGELRLVAVAIEE
jgi:hypothetical protein